MGISLSMRQAMTDKVIYISFITEIEIQSKKVQSRQQKEIIKNLLTDCVIIDINEKIKELTIRLRKQRAIKTPDAIIVATAQFLNFHLVSSEKSFLKIPNLNLIYFDSVQL
jgi:predicted nucleic acid-binding protein